MLKYAAAWLMMALLCSTNTPTLQENLTAVRLPPLSVQTVDVKEMHAADDAVYPEGLTEPEWEYLQEQREQLGALSFEERLSAVPLPHVHCLRLVHIPWEHSIPRSLIRVTGQVRYEVWVSAQRIDGKCADIYSFAERFSIDLEELMPYLWDAMKTAFPDMPTRGGSTRRALDSSAMWKAAARPTASITSGQAIAFMCLKRPSICSPISRCTPTTGSNTAMWRSAALAVRRCCGCWRNTRSSNRSCSVWITMPRGTRPANG